MSASALRDRLAGVEAVRAAGVGAVRAVPPARPGTVRARPRRGARAHVEVEDADLPARAARTARCTRDQGERLDTRQELKKYLLYR